MGDVDAPSAHAPDAVMPDEKDCLCPEERTSFHVTALHVACEKGRRQVAAELLAAGASKAARDSCGWTPLHWAARFGHLSCTALILSGLSAEEVDAVATDGATTLHNAALFGDEKVCGALIGAGARVDAKTAQGVTPLQLAQLKHASDAALLALLSGQVPPAKLPGTVCDACGEPGSVFCAACGGAVYCSAACMKAALGDHKKACEVRKARRKKIAG